MPNDSNERAANQSVSKLLHLLRCLSDSRIPMPLQEIAALTGMPQATILRYLNALIADGYAFQDSISNRYALTWKICEIGEQTRNHMNLRMIAGDLLNTVVSHLDFGVCLVIERDLECFYLDCIYDPKELGMSLVRIGKQTPMHASASGKILLSAFSDYRLNQLIEQKGLARLTDRTITSKEALLVELERVRQQGYAVDDEECETGLRCVGVPLYSYQDTPVAAISIFGSAERVTDRCIEQTILPLLFDIGDEISFRLGSSHPAHR